MLSLHLDFVGLLSNLHTNCMWILTKILLEINWKITISDWKSVLKLHWKITVKVTEECDYIKKNYIIQLNPIKLMKLPKLLQSTLQVGKVVQE